MVMSLYKRFTQMIKNIRTSIIIHNNESRDQKSFLNSSYAFDKYNSGKQKGEKVNLLDTSAGQKNK
jgi:hypothetical protein